MATNKYGQTYQGNDDFRGWLAGMGNDTGAKHLLNMVGNDGRVGEGGAYTEMYNKFYGPGPGRGPVVTAQGLADQYYKRWLAGRQELQNATPAANANYQSYASYSTTPTKTKEQLEAEERERVYRNSQINYYDQAIRQYDNQLNNLNGLLGELNKATDSSYNQQLNEARSSYNMQKANYNRATTQNKQNLQTERNQVTDTAARGLRGLQRLLGAMGAGGSSDALYVAPGAVTAQANQQLAGVNQNFGQNQQNIDSDWATYQTDYDNDLKKLADWRAGQVRSNEQNVLQQRMNLLAQKAAAYANRGQYGVSDGGKQAEITNLINSLNNRANELSKFVAPSYTGVSATYKAPSVSSYFESAGQPELNAKVQDVDMAGSSQQVPALQLLMGLRKREEE